MQLCCICHAPCFPEAGAYNIPEPGADKAALRFAREGDRDFYAVLLNNHAPSRRTKVNPRVAVLGLSPAATQIEVFARAFRHHRDYGRASVEAAFSGGLDIEIIGMLNGLGLAPKLGLGFLRPSLAEHPDVWVTSVVACATLGDKASSDAWDPARYEAAKRCIRERLIPELLYPGWSRLQAIVVLGVHAWKALEKTRTADGCSALASLRRAGKLLLRLPHPSGSNREVVGLAKKSAFEFPRKGDYVAEKLAEYRAKPASKQHQSLTEYVKRRETIWENVSELRSRILQLEAMT